MTSALRLGLATVVTAAVAAALALVSAAPYRVSAAPHARLRVAFSARPERIESCHTLSAKELENVPQHMRQAVVCEGTTATYRLEIRRGDSLVDSATVRGGGLRHDRRLYVLRELDVPSGRTAIDVRLRRVETVVAPPSEAARDSNDDAHREHAERDARDEHGEREGHEVPDAISRDLDERRRRVADEVPASLELREDVTLQPREVLLVTYDQASRRLRTVRESP